jgi:MFS family permease
MADIASTNTPVPLHAPRSGGSRWLALVVLCVGMLMIVLDATIVNVALPSIQDDLDFSQASLAWVVNGYLITFGGLLLLAGRLGDLIGRRRIFLIGLIVFIAASMLCAVAQSQAMLIGARFLQGAGGAITEAINWHWIFFVNLPIGVATALLALRLVERDQGIGLREGADVPGAVLVTSALMLLVYTILEAGSRGWGSAHTVGFGALSLLLLAGFVVREGRIANPMMPLRLFRSRNVAGANIVQALFVAGMFGMFFLGALYLQRVLGYGALEVGLAFLPVTVIIGTLSLGFSERLNMRFGPRAILLPALVLIAAGLAIFARVPVDGSYVVDILPVMVLLGMGAGLAFPSLMMLAMSGATRSDSGLASGLVNTTLQVGGAIGLAVLATLATTRTDSLLADGESSAEALTSGYHLAFLIGAVLVIVAIAVALTVLRPPAVVEQAEADGELTSPEPAYAEAA